MDHGCYTYMLAAASMLGSGTYASMVWTRMLWSLLHSRRDSCTHASASKLTAFLVSIQAIKHCLMHPQGKQRGQRACREPRRGGSAAGAGCPSAARPQGGCPEIWEQGCRRRSFCAIWPSIPGCGFRPRPLSCGCVASGVSDCSCVLT